MPDRMTFQFLDVGMGDGTLVQIRRAGRAYDELILVDFGEKRTQYKIPYQDAMTYLVDTINQNSFDRGAGRPVVDYLFLTHPDGDHYNKIAELVDQDYDHFPGRQLHFRDLYFSGRDWEYGDLITDTLDGLVDAPIDEMVNDWHSPIAHDGTVTPLLTFGGISVYVLSSNWPTAASANNPKSIVLAFDLDGHQVILTGDAEKKAEAHILDEFGEDFLDSTALKLGHHGSKSSSSPKWVSAVSPQFIFASGDSAWSHPYCEAICRYVDNGTLKDYWATNVYYACGNAGEYFDNPTDDAICMNLNYIVKTAGATENLVNSKGKAEIGFRYNAFGVQWEFVVEEGKDPELRSTTLIWPAPGQAIPPPWDCDDIARWAACWSQPPSGTRSLDNPLGL
jgi:competence protein ComEC